MMKSLFRRFAVLTLLVATAGGAFAAPARSTGGFNPDAPDYFERGWIDMFCWYVPNRILDALDIVTVEFGVGPAVGCHLELTKFLQLGGAYGESYEFGWAHRHQYGGGVLEARQYGFGWGNYNTSYQDRTWGSMHSYVFSIRDFECASIAEEPYRDNIVDPWAVGVRAGLLFNVDVKFHPLEVFDFVCGVVGYDLSRDDY